MTLRLFPHCDLHGVRIVHSFPNGCPMGYSNMAEKFVELKSRSFGHPDDPDAHYTVVCERIHAICNDCLERLGRDPHVQALRRRVGVS